MKLSTSLYHAAQRAFGALGLKLSVNRLNERSNPEVVNRALWKPFHTEDYWRRLYRETQAITKGDATDNIYRQCRFYSTFQMAAYAAALPVEGDFIECGCWHGHSATAFSTILQQHGFRGKFHVFDSFEGGLSEFTAKDESKFKLSAEEKAGMIATFRSDYDFVRSVTGKFGFVELHRGWIPDIFATFKPGPIKFVHVDVDMYIPTKAALEFFWENLVPGGCIVVDDYNHGVFEGATLAVDEFMADKKPALYYKVPFCSSCFIIK
jgi:O-methyltransferase